MYEITVAEHSAFTIPTLGFRGTPVGIDMRRVVELGITATHQYGHRPPRGRSGQVGAGLVTPAACFIAAGRALAAEWPPQ